MLCKNFSNDHINDSYPSFMHPNFKKFFKRAILHRYYNYGEVLNLELEIISSAA